MKKFIFALVAISAILASCTDAKQAKLLGYGSTFTVKVLGPDTIITYQSSGKVSSEANSDGYYFNDAKTGKLVEVSGTVIVEQN